MTQEKTDLHLILQGNLHLGKFPFKKLKSYKLDPVKELEEHPKGVLLVKAYPKINTVIKFSTSTHCRITLIDRGGYITGMFPIPFQEKIFMKKKNELLTPDAGEFVLVTTKMIREPYILILPQENDQLEKITIRFNMNELELQR